MNSFVSISFLLMFGLRAIHAQTHDGSLSASQLQGFAKALPVSEGKIYALIPFLDESEGGSTSIAVLSSPPRQGWRVAVYGSAKKPSFHLLWSSGKLDDSFAVSSPSQLTIYGLGSGNAVSFGGCARHICPEIFSELLYIPGKKRSYSATCQNGTVRYSFSISDDANAEIKSGLDNLLRNQPDEKACGPNF